MTMRSRSLLLAAALLLPFAGACFSDGPDEVAQQFITSLRDGEISTAMDLVSNESRQALGDARLRNVLNEGFEGDELEGVTVTASDSAISRDGRSAKVQLLRNGEESGMGAMPLIKEDGRWKIDFSEMVGEMGGR